LICYVAGCTIAYGRTVVSNGDVRDTGKILIGIILMTGETSE